MKTVISVAGARPNFVKVAPVARALKRYADRVRHHIVHTGQHYDEAMSDVFFRDLEIDPPAFSLGVGSASHAVQTARIMTAFEPVCAQVRPDMVLVVGDVNSTAACALVAAKLGVPVGHVEAGLRSFDRSMPEEINRVVTDAISDYAFVTEESGRANLLKEGWNEQRIFLVGNTMIDSQMFAMKAAERSPVLGDLGLSSREYALMTLHRPSNVDDPAKLRSLLDILAWLSDRRIVVFPVHPRTRKNIRESGLDGGTRPNTRLRFIDPVGYVEFLALMKNSDFVITDSGGIQEETTALGVPCVTLRTSTERPVTCALGTNVLVKPEPDAIRAALSDILAGNRRKGAVPPLWDGKAGERIAEIVSTRLLG